MYLETTIARFREFTPDLPTDVCWPWLGPLDTHGYGRFWVPDLGIRTKAHRVAWEIENGSALGKLHACHRCDNPPCVNPAHIFQGTSLDNMRDMIKKGRAKHPPLKGERNGQSIFTEDDVRVIRARLAAGEKLKPIATSYGVTIQAISLIKRRINWSHLE